MNPASQPTMASSTSPVTQFLHRPNSGRWVHTTRKEWCEFRAGSLHNTVCGDLWPKRVRKRLSVAAV